jgi:hypothetical protein
MHFYSDFSEELQGSVSWEYGCVLLLLTCSVRSVRCTDLTRESPSPAIWIFLALKI